MRERLGRIGAAGDETELFALLAQCKEIDRQLENLKSTSNEKGENG
jgi:hypothetical protein